MSLELDTRQRAMLQEMGVHVWLPESGIAVLKQAPATVQRVGQAAGVAVATGKPATEAVQRVPTPAITPLPAGQVKPVVHPTEAAPGWPTLQEAVRNCQACGLCAGRTQATLLPPPDGAACDWMVVGDAPDEDEDRAGAPFAGPDGVLLGNMLRALGLQRANPFAVGAASAPVAATVTTVAAQRAYVSNVLKCRPAHGAMPQAAELAQCASHLQQEIALVQPKMILAMGRYANQVLLSESPDIAALPLGKLRGSVHRYRGVPLVVTYPPKLLMRNSADKAKAWADMCLAAATLAG